MKNNLEQDGNGHLARESSEINKVPESGRDFHTSPKIETLTVEVNDLCEELEKKIKKEIDIGDSKKRLANLKGLQKRLVERKVQIEKVNSPRKKIDEMENFSEVLRGYLGSSWVSSSDVNTDTIELHEQFERDLANVVNGGEKRRKSPKKPWVENLSANAKIRRRSIEDKFPIGENFIKRENEFPVSDFFVKEIVMGEGPGDDRIKVIVDGVAQEMTLAEADDLTVGEGYIKQSKLDNRKPDKRIKNATKEDENRLREKFHPINEVQKMFSDDGLEQYLESFENLTESQLQAKKVFFKKTKKDVIALVREQVKKGVVDIDAGSIIDDFLASSVIYSKIRKVIKTNEDKKNVMNREQPLDTIKDNGWTEREEREFDEEFKDGWRKKTAEANSDRNKDLDGWTNEEKADFDTEFQEGWKKKSVEARPTADLQREVCDLWKKRGELLTAKKQDKDAFQDNEKRLQAVQAILKARGEEYSALALENIVDEPRNTDTDMNEEEKFDREVQRRAEAGKRVSRDTDMNEEEKFNKEVKRRADENEKKEEAGPDVHALKSAMEEARALYAKKHHQSTNAWSQLKSYFGNTAENERKQNEEEMQSFKDSYREKYLEYRNARIAELENTSDDEAREVLAEIKKMDVEEGIALYDGRGVAKAEAMSGGISEKAIKAIEWYKKLKTWKKIAAGLVFAGGAYVSTTAAVGVFSGAMLAKRVLGAGAAGVGTAEFLEARSRGKEDVANKEILDKFSELSPEEQKTQLMSFDTASFDTFDQNFNEKVRGRRKRVLAGIGATAGIMMLGSAGKLFAAGESIEAVEKPYESKWDDTFSTADFAVNADAGAPGMDIDNTFAASPAEVAESEKYTEWFNKVTIFDDVELDFISNGAEDTEAFRDFRREYGPVAFKKYMDVHPQLSEEEAIRRWNGGIKMRHSSLLSKALEEVRNTPEGEEFAKKVQEIATAIEGSGGNSVYDNHVERLKDEFKNTKAFAQFEQSRNAEAYQKFMNNDEITYRTADGDIVDTPEEKQKLWNKKTEIAYRDFVHKLEAEKGVSYMDINKPPEGPIDPVRAKEIDDFAADFNNENPPVIESSLDNADSTLQAATGEVEGNFDATPVINKFATAMGIKDPSDVKFVDGTIPFEINGQSVPEELYSLEEKSAVQDYLENLKGDDSSEATPENVEETPRAVEGENLEVVEDISLNEIAQENTIYEEGISGFTEEMRTTGAFTKFQETYGPGAHLDELEKKGVGWEVAWQREVQEQSKIYQTLAKNQLERKDLLAGEVNGELLRDRADESLSTEYVDDTPSVNSELLKEEAEKVFQTDRIEALSEEKLKELISSPDFTAEVGNQMSEVYGMPAKNIGGAKMGFFEGSNQDVSVRFEELKQRAVKHLGEKAGNPSNAKNVGNFFTRVFAQAVHQDKVRDVFPSSDFTV